MRWIIGDIHGMLRPLETLLEVLHRRDPSAELYFCGDYADRGPETRGVVDLLLTLKNARFVRGNHDDVIDLCCNGKSFGTGPHLGGDVDPETLIEVYQLFWNEGLAETLTSYGVDPSQGKRQHRPDEPLADWVRRQFDPVPETHRRFFRELPAVAEADGFFVAHATWPADYLDEDGRMNSTLLGDAHLRHDVLWSRYSANQIRSKKSWDRVGYFGHTPTDNYLGHADLIRSVGSIIRGEKCVLIDTGAFARGGRLSAVCHDDGSVVQVHRTGEVLENYE